MRSLASTGRKIDKHSIIWLFTSMKGKKIWATLHPFFEGGSILGRNVANEGFLTALLRASPYDEFAFFLHGQEQAERQKARLSSLFPELVASGALRCATRHSLPQVLAEETLYCAHLSDCLTDFMPMVRLRNALSQNIFPVTGTTHSLSYVRYAPVFFSQLWAGISRRDAVIATSTAGQGAVQAMFSSLREGYGLDPQRFPFPRVERIPLGVNPEEFPDPQADAALGASMREELGMAGADVMLLVFARVSHYSKMDFLPLFRAVRRAQAGLGAGGPRLRLVLAGWAEDGDSLPEQYAKLAERLGVSVTLALSPDKEARRKLYAAADIFLSPVDNIQETFGLTLLEAGISGLPVIASNFDGYRDIVVHEQTGLLIPTLGPLATPETDALAGVWFDNQYHLQLAQQSVVDVPTLAKAIAALATDPARRLIMGEAARARVLTSFTWDAVIKRHVALWDALASAPVGRPPHSHPLQPGFAQVFGGYYSALLTEDVRRGRQVRWTTSGEAIYRGLEAPVFYAGIERLVDTEKLKLLLFKARKPVLLADLLPRRATASVAPVPEDERDAFLLLWALKQDLLELVR